MYTPTSILESGLFPPSTGLCKSVKYAKNKATSEYSILKVLSLCKYFITLVTVPGSHLEYAAPVWDPTNRDLSTHWRELVQKFALKVCTKNWSSGYECLLQSCNLLLFMLSVSTVVARLCFACEAFCIHVP